MKEKIRIMKTPPPVTDEEIHSFMDFDELLRKKEAFVRNRHRIRRIRTLALILATAITLPSALLLWQAQRPSGFVADGNVPKPAQAPQAQLPVADTLELPAPAKERPSPADRKEKAAKALPARPESETPDKSAPANDTGREQPVYVQAEPADGYPALYSYFGRNLQYPASAVKDSVEGVVSVAFVIDTSGKATQIVIEKSLGKDFDKEAVRLMENMPLWKPASYGGIPVRSKISLPITFSLVRKPNP